MAYKNQPILTSPDGTDYPLTVNNTGIMNVTGGSVDGGDVGDLPVSALADGVDGELITWDAAGAPTTVATGNSGQVLTSNGVGTAPTFQSLGYGGNYVFASDNTTQTVAIADTFQGINFATNQQIDGWAHTAATSTFTCNQTGLYLVSLNALAQKSGGANAIITLRLQFNAVIVTGSGTAVNITSNNRVSEVSTTALVSATTGQDLEAQFTGTTTNIELASANVGGNTAKITITRIA